MVHVTLAMGWADFQLKYRGSVMGYLWSLAVPLVKFLVLLVIFQPILGGNIVMYPLYLFLGVIVWEHFALTTTACITSLLEKTSIIQKVAFPRFLLPIAAGWCTFLIFLSHVLLFFIFALIFRVEFHFAALLAPFLVLCMELLTLGIGMLLAAFALRFQDIRHLWEVTLQILFWLTPVLYAPELTGPVRFQATELFMALEQSPLAIVRAFIHLQPLSLLMTDIRRVLLYTGVRSTPSLEHLVFLFFISVSAFAFGSVVFWKRSRYFAQEI
jgi:ABC-type polysaccharide/polyol phosphate export permease